MSRFEKRFLIGIAWVAGASVIMGFLVFPQVESKAPPKSRSCRGNLHRIGLALWMYRVEQGSFPPAYLADETGRPMHSWRVLLLPYLDEGPLYAEYDFDEPWDGPHNSTLHDRFDQLYRSYCPSNRNGLGEFTSYLAVVGPKTAWRGDKPVVNTAFTDGTDQTIFVVEVKDTGINWAEPRDLEFDSMSFQVNPSTGTGISSAHFEEYWFAETVPYVHVMTADGSVRKLPASTKPAVLKALLTIDGGEAVGEPWLE